MVAEGTCQQREGGKARRYEASRMPKQAVTYGRPGQYG